MTQQVSFPREIETHPQKDRNVQAALSIIRAPPVASREAETSNGLQPGGREEKKLQSM